jgi:ubiquinone/menaquinone biosynthesis C-methylase UbiE
MERSTISRAEARRLYDTIGTRLDRAARYESRARARALAVLAPVSGQRVLQVGVGTGGAQLALDRAVAPGGLAVGVDLSRVMLDLTRRRVAAPSCQGDAIALPFAAHSFDRIFSAYLLDLVPADDLAHALAEFARVLRPTGQLALVSLTEGVDSASRLFVAIWKLRFLLAPRSLGGCRPLRLEHLVMRAGFVIARREVIVQRGFPSEIVVATLPTGLG